MRVVVYALVMAAAWPQTVLAQTFQKTTATQLFIPAVATADSFFSVEGASVPRHLDFGLGLMLNYQHKPLVLFTSTTTGSSGEFDISDADREIPIVDNQLTADLYGAVGLHYRWLHTQLGLSLPINLVLRGTDVDARAQEQGTFSGEGIGDLRLHFKFVIFSNLAGISLAFAPILTLPTACLSTGGLSSCETDGSLAGEGSVTGRPRLLAHFRWGKLLAAVNVGAIFRGSTQVFSSEVTHRLTYGVAGGYQLHRHLFAMAELVGQAGFGTRSECTQNPADPSGPPVCSGTSSNDLDAFPLELDFGAHIPLPKGFQVTAGVGFGLIKALGSPQVRVLSGVRWTPDLRDTDRDGISDREDRCPTEAEDRDGFSDSDGCPDPDNDKDLIPDRSDKCPDQPEDRDTYQDDDGCPDPDNDGDGIPDLHDHCPFKPETRNGFKDQDGCPDVPDHDEDTVADTVDKCPKQKEDIDQFEDTDGCPDPDNDKDGIPDSYDDCPNKAEDPDGVQDDDGCPDLDQDQDTQHDAGAQPDGEGPVPAP